MTTYVDGEGVVWRRVGECNQCGECCTDGADPSINNPMFTDAEREAATIPNLCPLLRFCGADGKFACAGHGKHEFYLNGCNTHPLRPEDLIRTPSCSYSFERVS